MIKFIADNMMGKVAKYLRMLGYDTIFPPPRDTRNIIQKAQNENRTILTRSSRLFEKIPDQNIILYFDSNEFDQQLNLIWKEFDLKFDPSLLFSRCLECNTELIEVNKNQIIEQLPPKIKENFDKFRKCQVCDKIYWQGGHTKRMVQNFKDTLKAELD